MADQKGEVPKGGTMRLGAYPCSLRVDSRLHAIYDCDEIQERHRHRYEVNNEYRQQLEQAGVVFSGTSPDGHLVEAMEYAEHLFFVGVQYHPEFKRDVYKRQVQHTLSNRPPCCDPPHR